MKLPTLLGILERAILEAPAGPNEQPASVTLAVSVARDLRDEIMSLGVLVASHQKHIHRLESATVSLQRSNDSFSLAFKALEGSMNAEIKRQEIYDAQLKAQLDFTADVGASNFFDDPVSALDIVDASDPIRDYPQAKETT